VSIETELRRRTRTTPAGTHPAQQAKRPDPIGALPSFSPRATKL